MSKSLPADPLPEPFISMSSSPLDDCSTPSARPSWCIAASGTTPPISWMETAVMASEEAACNRDADCRYVIARLKSPSEVLINARRACRPSRHGFVDHRDMYFAYQLPELRQTVRTAHLVWAVDILFHTNFLQATLGTCHVERLESKFGAT